MEPCERFGSVGSPSFSIPRAYLMASLDLLISGTERIKKEYTFHPDTYEDDITRKLVAKMHAEQDETGKHIIRVDIFSGTLSDSTSPYKLSEIDIRFTWNNFNPNSYLAVQAKRLYGTGPTLAGPYVEEGVMDFINGKYSSEHKYGIMLGYVLSKPIEKATLAVKDALQKRKIMTNETFSFKVDRLIDYPLIYKSGHVQKNNGMTINIFHIFVDLAS